MHARLPSLLLLLTLAACPQEDGKGSDTETSSGEQLKADEVCPAACETFKGCSDDPAMFDVANCEESCESGVTFLDMNNPGAGCGQTELGRQDCLSKATCEELDLYVTDDAMQPCKEWDDKLGECAIE